MPQCQASYRKAGKGFLLCVEDEGHPGPHRDIKGYWEPEDICGARPYWGQPKVFCDGPPDHEGPHSWEHASLYATRVLGPKLDALIASLPLVNEAVDMFMEVWFGKEKWDARKEAFRDRARADHRPDG